ALNGSDGSPALHRVVSTPRFREEEMQSCSIHPDVASAALCSSCMSPICERCITRDGERELCPLCGERHRRYRAARRRGILLSAVGAAVVATVIGFIVKRAVDSEVNALRAAVEKNPCDRDSVLRLAREHMQRNDPRAAIA